MVSLIFLSGDFNGSDGSAGTILLGTGFMLLVMISSLLGWCIARDSFSFRGSVSSSDVPLLCSSNRVRLAGNRGIDLFSLLTTSGYWFTPRVRGTPKTEEVQEGLKIDIDLTSEPEVLVAVGVEKVIEDLIGTRVSLGVCKKGTSLIVVGTGVVGLISVVKVVTGVSCVFSRVIGVFKENCKRLSGGILRVFA